MAEKIKSIKDLEQARASATAQGSTLPDYNQWSQILNDLAEAGVQSTGSFSTDKALHGEIEKTVKDYLDQQKIGQVEKQNQMNQNQTKNNTENDKEQGMKATVANATSSVIVADYMKYYHLLM